MIKPISQQKALVQLTRVIETLRSTVMTKYEHRAASCATCETPGLCCLDEHFVNVRISRLEAVRIRQSIERLPAALRERVIHRTEAAIAKFDLREDAGSPDQRFACPLFENGVGCLVHNGGKPVPCIMHACYEAPEHLPPESLKDQAELTIERLNVRTYGHTSEWLPIPLALKAELGATFKDERDHHA